MRRHRQLKTEGFFGKCGGQYVPEILMQPLKDLTEAYNRLKSNREFNRQLQKYLSEYAGRPTPLYHAENLSRHCGGAQILLKREDLLHGGAHKINNTLGQGLLARSMKKKRIIAETGGGQTGDATALACA